MIRPQVLLAELGRRVREARERAGLSLSELARRADLKNLTYQSRLWQRFMLICEKT